MTELDRAEIAIHKIVQEYQRATSLNGPFHSAHEGFGVIYEEYDELKAEVWKNELRRDYEAMMKEAVQLAAMAMRFVVDVCLEDGRVMSNEQGETSVP